MTARMLPGRRYRTIWTDPTCRSDRPEPRVIDSEAGWNDIEVRLNVDVLELGEHATQAIRIESSEWRTGRWWPPATAEQFLNQKLRKRRIR